MTVMITRRTLRRTHLLRPDRALNNLFVYCLAVLARHYGVAVHAAVLMSTHEHMVVTDTRGELPRFLHEHHRLFALGVKALRKWEGAVWDHHKTSVVELRTQAAVVEKVAYVMANPVTAGLVSRAKDWPGVSLTAHAHDRCSASANRPDYYFDRENSRWPETATLELAMPPCESPAETIRDAVAAELEYLERDAAERARASGRRPPKPKQLLKRSPYDRATSAEPYRDCDPHFAVGRGQREAFMAALLALREFRAAYREALKQWCAGIRDTVFPAGTWLMNRLHVAPMCT